MYANAITVTPGCNRRWSGLPAGFALLAVMLLLYGCATTGGGADASRPTDNSAREMDASGAQMRESVAAGASTAEAQAVPTTSAQAGDVTSILRERRRSEYPLVATSEAGFTVTEPARIAGNVRSTYDTALVALRAERFNEGIELLERIVADTPELTTPYIELGVAYARVDELDKAAAALETAAVLSPDHPIVRNELGIVYRRLGRFAESREQYEAAIAVYPAFHYARRNLGVLCDLYLADPQCALQNYRAFLDSVGEDAEVEIWIADLENRISQVR